LASRALLAEAIHTPSALMLMHITSLLCPNILFTSADVKERTDKNTADNQAIGLRTRPQSEVSELALQRLCRPVDARHAARLLIGLLLLGHELLRLVGEAQLGNVRLLDPANDQCASTRAQNCQ
jgi:hypothetical protein